MTERSIVFQWEASAFFGWGIYGLNLALNARGVTLATACRLDQAQMRLDGARAWALRDFLGHSQALGARLANATGRIDAPDSLVLHSLGNDLTLQSLGLNGTTLYGKRTVGITFLERARLDAAAMERSKAYDLIVAGSTWNGALLKAEGLDRVETVLQGIDPTLFHPAPRGGLFDGRFAIFSGGKLEFRKGQDIVLKAFRLFRERHPEALLVTAWHSPWSRMGASSLERVPGLAPVSFTPDDRIDVAGWAMANGVPADAVVDLGSIPNALMGPLLREADVALFPNRCEGGTNLVAMEAMACGVPVVLSANTGHLDLIGPANCYPLRRQAALSGRGGVTEGWGESDVDEIVEALEAVYTDRATARDRVAAGAADMAALTWKRQIGVLLQTLGVAQS